MSFLSKFKNKHVWNNQELQQKSQTYDKISIVAMILIILSAWLSPQYFPDYSRAITLVFVGLSILFIYLSWHTEKQDSKYAPPPVDETSDNNEGR